MDDGRLGNRRLRPAMKRAAGRLSGRSIGRSSCGSPPAANAVGGGAVASVTVGFVQDEYDDGFKSVLSGGGFFGTLRR